MASRSAVADYLKLARPHNWIKNVVVLMPIIFGMSMHIPSAWLHSIAAVIAFCFVSSFAYILNDIRDLEADRRHPVKRTRPLAAGKISVKDALIEAVILMIFAAAISLAVSPALLAMIILYAVLQVAYSLLLKNFVLIDVIVIAIGFVLRAVAGAVAISVQISPWLFICLFTICLFMGFCKRYNEMMTLANGKDAHYHRATLIEYTPDLLTHLISTSAGIAIITFLLYSISERTTAAFGTNYLVYSLPFVVYGIFRFALLSMKGAYSDPTDIMLKDRPFQATVMLWIIFAAIITLYGKEIAAWFRQLM
ncbi:Decaprenyl-phosphate phosphoribosyltransferase [Anaerohalosphaera lusitana]|uniref:Decaprenyl-phosphate phosphoribosyltransferase n=1 Tax=Anaerohalosphaera lusitana TaxID=1936003 RepID=A0A1U9NRB4_9BACT|nr:decaprenyl-phosphate phosphoribosyltransferase [Anaerohalosphaera lusitana]AQT70345.1 Decaprenyl-phosphate phosphoribosyltransferase [Anaerohalosphaera lusitana]